MPASTKTKHSRNQSSVSHISRASTNVNRTEITINVYDLLPQGRLSSFLWFVGSGLLHSGVVIRDREYAYGGHNKRGKTGVYWTRPQQVPPGGTYRCDVLHGFTFRSDEEIEHIIEEVRSVMDAEVSERFQGTTYNLLTQNCNHFTSALCSALTGKAAPSWLNRAASIGVALPCMVPKEWVVPPDADTADGELLDHDGEDDGSTAAELGRDSDEEPDERSGMMDSERRRQRRQRELNRALVNAFDNPPATRDSSGRKLPVAERAPA